MKLLILLKRFVFWVLVIGVGGAVTLGLLKLSANFSPFSVGTIVGSSALNISYVDFVSIMLTGVSIILAALGIVFAIVALIGWNSIGDKASSSATTFLNQSVKEGGGLHNLVRTETQKMISSLTIEFLSNSVKEGGAVYEIVKKESEAIIFKGIQPASLSDDTNENEATK